MSENTEILENLKEIIAHASHIVTLNPPLGRVLLFAISMSMDLIESIAQDEVYTVRDVVDFIAKSQGLTPEALLEKSYLEEQEVDPTITKLIVDSTSCIDGYAGASEELLRDFKETVSKIRS